MDPERWERLKDLFLRLTALPPRDRVKALFRLQETDPSLKEELEELLRSHQESPPTIQSALFPPAPAPPAWEASRRVGPYELLGSLGRGGMGEVFRARRADGVFKKEVALKLLKTEMQSPEMVAHFQRERQILASLEHPYIARLLDGGTTPDGSPYFVMELVQGTPLIEYARHQQLKLRERIQLFQKVCEAVNFAHRHLVIHRDLKPGNILVTGDGTPKLLDFGIAKLQEAAETDLAVTRVLTPDYASPEQIRGERLRVATDVYSLGVILYELLSGRKPYQIESLALGSLEKIICETEPPPPSTVEPREDGGRGVQDPHLSPVGQLRHLSASLRRDLDNVVLKAMHKDPSQRYASPRELSADLENFLQGRPVQATRDSTLYRVGKFVRRHRIGVAAALLLVLSLVGGIVTTSWQAAVASRERARAEQRFRDVHRLANSLLFEIHTAIRRLPGATAARQLLITRALEYLDRLSSEQEQDPSLLPDLAMAYLEIGNVLGNPNDANLGDSEAALDSYRKALALSGDVESHNGGNLRTLRIRALVREKMGDVYAWRGDLEAAEENAHMALAAFAELSRLQPSKREARMALAISHIKLGDLLGNPHFPNRSQPALSLQEYQNALSILRGLVDEDPEEVTGQRHLAMIFERLGSIHELLQEGEAATLSYRKSLSLRHKLAQRFPHHAEIQRDLAVAYEKMGLTLCRLEQREAGVEQLRQSFEIFQRLAEADPDNAMAQRSLAISCLHLGDGLAQLPEGREEAVRYYRRGAALMRDLLAKDPTGVRHVQLLETFEKRLQGETPL